MCLFVSIATSLQSRIYNIIELNRFCFPMVVSNDSSILAKLMSILFTVLVPVVISIVAFLIWTMISKAEESSKIVNINSQGGGTQNTSYNHLKYINLVKFTMGPSLSWLPLCVLFVIQLCGVSVDPAVTVWICVSCSCLCTLTGPFVHTKLIIKQWQNTHTKSLTVTN